MIFSRPAVACAGVVICPKHHSVSGTKLYHVMDAGQAMGMGTSHPKQLQSIPESPSHPQATMDSSPGNHLSSHLEQQGDHLLGPSTSQPSHAAAAGLDQAGRAPFEPIRCAARLDARMNLPIAWTRQVMHRHRVCGHQEDILASLQASLGHDCCRHAELRSLLNSNQSPCSCVGGCGRVWLAKRAAC